MRRKDILKISKNWEEHVNLLISRKVISVKEDVNELTLKSKSVSTQKSLFDTTFTGEIYVICANFSKFLLENMTDEEYYEYDEKVVKMLISVLEKLIATSSKSEGDIRLLEKNIKAALIRFESKSYQSNEHNFWGTAKIQGGKMLIMKENRGSQTTITEYLNNGNVADCTPKSAFTRNNSYHYKGREEQLYERCFTGRFSSDKRRKSIESNVKPKEPKQTPKIEVGHLQTKFTNKSIKRQNTQQQSKTKEYIYPIKETKDEEDDEEEKGLLVSQSSTFMRGATFVAKEKESEQEPLISKAVPKIQLEESDDDNESLCTEYIDPQELPQKLPQELPHKDTLHANHGKSAFSRDRVATVVTISRLDTNSTKEKEKEKDVPMAPNSSASERSKSSSDLDRMESKSRGVSSDEESSSPEKGPVNKNLDRGDSSFSLLSDQMLTQKKLKSQTMRVNQNKGNDLRDNPKGPKVLE